MDVVIGNSKSEICGSAEKEVQTIQFNRPASRLHRGFLMKRSVSFLHRKWTNLIAREVAVSQYAVFRPPLKWDPQLSPRGHQNLGLLRRYLP